MNGKAWKSIGNIFVGVVLIAIMFGGLVLLDNHFYPGEQGGIVKVATILLYPLMGICAAAYLKRMSLNYQIIFSCVIIAVIFMVMKSYSLKFDLSAAISYYFGGFILGSFFIKNGFRNKGGRRLFKRKSDVR